MEEKKAVAYYEELTSKGEGAARFKQGLGFSSSDSPSSPPRRGSAIPSSSSFYNAFVKSSNPSKASAYANNLHLETIQNKLKRRDGEDELNRGVARRASRNSSNNRRRSRSRSCERRHNDRSKSNSPNRVVTSKVEKRRNYPNESKENPRIDYSKAIKGYENMTPAEKVKARMKFQLSEAAGKDKTKGCGWERFEFNKDAPLDDEEIEVAEDDGALVKQMGQSFRFSSLEAKREKKLKDAHDQAIFGVPLAERCISESGEEERVKEDEPNKSLLSETMLAKQQGSWRDRARRL